MDIHEKAVDPPARQEPPRAPGIRQAGMQYEVAASVSCFTDRVPDTVAKGIRLACAWAAVVDGPSNQWRQIAKTLAPTLLREAGIRGARSPPLREPSSLEGHVVPAHD